MTLGRRVMSPLLVGLVAALVSACAAAPTPSATPGDGPTPSATAVPSATARASAAASASPTSTTEPTAMPEPSLALDPPDASDDRRVAVSVQADVPTDADGLITVEVTSLAESMIDELVLRWPTALADTLFLAPFAPSEDRIREGGPPLVQAWTKWVVGPGEQGEPDGTTSLGYGPLPAGGSLTIPIVVTRVANGPIAFDLQVLARNDLLAFEDGSPAELRVEVP